MTTSFRSDLGHLNLVGLTDLSIEWGVSRQRVQVLTREPTFPKPAIELHGPNGRVAHRLWVADEARDWRRKQMKGM